MIQKRWLILLLLYGWGQSVLAAEGSDPACASAPHRQLDFWLGEWDVYNVRNELAAHSRIAAMTRGLPGYRNTA